MFTAVTRWPLLVRFIANLVIAAVRRGFWSHPFSAPFVYGLGVTQRHEKSSDKDFGGPLLWFSSSPGPPHSSWGDCPGILPGVPLDRKSRFDASVLVSLGHSSSWECLQGGLPRHGTQPMLFAASIFGLLFKTCLLFFVHLQSHEVGVGFFGLEFRVICGTVCSKLTFPYQKQNVHIIVLKSNKDALQ